MEKCMRAVIGAAIGAAVLASFGHAGHRSQLADIPAPLTPAWVVPGEGRGVPALDRSTAYFLSKRHEVLAIDVRSGRVKWRRVTGESGDQTMGSEVILTNGLLVVGDYNVVGLDARSGGIRWRFVPAEGYGPGIYIGPDVEDGLAYAGSPANTLYAIDVENGRARWSTRIEAGATVTVHQPHICRNLAIAGYTRFAESTTGGIVALDRKTGTLKWRTELSGASARTTRYAGGPLCIGSRVAVAGGDGSIYGLDVDTGSVVWQLPPAPRDTGSTPDNEIQDYRPLVHANGSLIAGSLTGQVTAYDVMSTNRLWTWSAGGGSVALRMRVDRQSVFVPHMDGLLIALDVRNGREEWRTKFTTGFTWPPAFTKDRILLASSASGFQAFERPHR
jgi:outer membrane protein assembly factor BamB